MLAGSRWKPNSTVTWYAQTKDVFGGVSTSQTYKITVSPSGC